MRELAGHEVVGARLVGQLPAAAMVDLWRRVTSRIIKYGFVVEYRDLDAPRTGIFDGLRIAIDPDVGFEMQCFLLLHLFGHSVQWVAPSLRSVVHQIEHTADRDSFMQVLRDYEFQAAGFGMRLLHEAGAPGLDQWYSDFVHTDWRYVERYYAENRLPPWEECTVNGAALIEPIDIPPLELREVTVRFAF
jgi:hypothetical protein